MYFATTANDRSETKAVGDTFTEPILMTYIYGRANAQLFIAVTFCTQSIFFITLRTAEKISLPTTTSKIVFEEVYETSTDQLCCSSSSLDECYTDTEVGKLRDIESYKFKPGLDEIQAKMAKTKEGLESGVRVHNGSLFF